jgi:hypothetical protein
MIGKIMYGAVTLDLTKVNDVQRTPIFDDSGTDYLCTETSVDVIAVLNPAATSFADVAAGVPQAGAAFAGRTDRLLFDYLSNPSDANGVRKVLKMWAFDSDGSRVTYLESPPQGQGRGGALPSDCRNGPKCQVFGISGADVHGAKTWILHLRFVTWINNCLDGYSPILSHRWERNVDYDDQFRAIATTRGIVHFNVGRLWGSGFSPDHFRSQFFQPPADNMARAHVNVQIASDNATASYTVIDGERFYSLGTTAANPEIGGPRIPQPAVNLEATLQTWYSQGSAYAALAQTAPIAWSIAADVLSSPMSPLENLRRLARPVEAYAGNLQAQLPRYYAKINVRAHGARNSARSDLANLCFAVAFSRLGNPSYFSLANRSVMVMVQKLHDNFVELDCTFHWMDQIFTQLAGILGPPGAIAASAALLLANDNGQRFMRAYFPPPTNGNPLGNDTYERPRDPPIGGVPGALNELVAFGQPLPNVPAETNPLLSQRPIGNHPMNNDPQMQGATNSRGIGYMKFLITQALMGTCPTIPTPVWDTPAGNGGAPVVPPVTVQVLPRS